MEHTMVTLPDDLLFSMNRVDFVALAERILEKFGTDTHFGRKYSDAWIEVSRDYHGFEVTRQKQDVPKEGHRRSHLSVSNPTTMVTKDGEIIRHHGEYCYLVWYMHQLMDETITAERY